MTASWKCSVIAYCLTSFSWRKISSHAMNKSKMLFLMLNTMSKSKMMTEKSMDLKNQKTRKQKKSTSPIKLVRSVNSGRRKNGTQTQYLPLKRKQIANTKKKSRRGRRQENKWVASLLRHWRALRRRSSKSRRSKRQRRNWMILRTSKVRKSMKLKRGRRTSRYRRSRWITYILKPWNGFKITHKRWRQIGKGLDQELMPWSLKCQPAP